MLAALRAHSCLESGRDTGEGGVGVSDEGGVGVSGDGECVCLVRAKCVCLVRGGMCVSVERSGCLVCGPPPGIELRVILVHHALQSVHRPGGRGGRKERAIVEGRGDVCMWRTVPFLSADCV